MTTNIDSACSRVPQRRHVLVAAEGGIGLLALARCALNLASPDASLHLAAVTGNPATLFPWISLRAEEWSDAHKALVVSSRTALSTAARHLAETHNAPDTSLVDLSTEHRPAADAVSVLAAQMDASLIAVTAFGRGERGRGIWHIDPEELAAACACPILYVPYVRLEDGHMRMRKVMIGVDGSQNARDALSFAIANAPRDALIHVVYVVDHALGLRNAPRITGLMREGMRALAEADAFLREDGRVGETTLIGTSTSARTVAESIAHEAQRWHADLLVLGSRGRSALTRWLLGSVAERSLRAAQQPVLIVPAFDDRRVLRDLRDEMAKDSESVLSNDPTLPPIFL